MNTLNLTIPLTIPQLAEMMRAQLSPAERQQLVELMQVPASPSVADDLREAFTEVQQAERGQKQFRSLAGVLDELQG